jgi:hypothetical protein
MSGSSIHLDSQELERMIRRIVREEVSDLLRPAVRSILDDWNQEGPEDAEGDAELLLSALSILRENEDRIDAWMRWEDFEEDLAAREGTGDLPD